MAERRDLFDGMGLADPNGHKPLWVDIDAEGNGFFKFALGEALLFLTQFQGEIDNSAIAKARGNQRRAIAFRAAALAVLDADFRDRGPSRTEVGRMHVDPPDDCGLARNIDQVFLEVPVGGATAPSLGVLRPGA